MNAAEDFAATLAEKTFLKLWSYRNPLKSDRRKELCDVLVVCDPDVIIISVKDRDLGHRGDDSTEWNRWHKRAVEESVKQIYGAQRQLETMNCVIRDDRTDALPLPPPGRRRIHRIAVACGGKGQVTFRQSDFGKGFVHVFDEVSFYTVLRELDTITDLVNYLAAKEHLITGGTSVHLAGEEDLLAHYLYENRTFPEGRDVLAFEPGAWETITGKPEFIAKKKEDRVSYLWDTIIDTIGRDAEIGRLITPTGLSDAEKVLRMMAREPRFSRRILARNFTELIQPESAPPTRARISIGSSGNLYVLMAVPRDTAREARRKELEVRCFAARGMRQEFDTVVGIATERHTRGVPCPGCSYDTFLLTMPEWTSVHQRILDDAHSKGLCWAEPRIRSQTEDEYPGS